MPRSQSRWSTITVTVDIATKCKLQEAERQHGLPLGGFVKMVLGNYLDMSEGASTLIYSNLRHELFLKRIFFFVTGGNEALCRSETATIEELIAARFKPPV